MTLIQPHNFVYRNFNSVIYSFVVKIEIEVKNAVELVNTIPLFGFINYIVDVPMADPDPIKFSVIINIIFFLFKHLNFFLS